MTRRSGNEVIKRPSAWTRLTRGPLVATYQTASISDYGLTWPRAGGRAMRRCLPTREH